MVFIQKEKSHYFCNTVMKSASEQLGLWYTQSGKKLVKILRNWLLRKTDVMQQRLALSLLMTLCIVFGLSWLSWPRGCKSWKRLTTLIGSEKAIQMGSQTFLGSTKQKPRQERPATTSVLKGPAGFGWRKKISLTGNRTRAAAVRAPNPSH